MPLYKVIVPETPDNIQYVSVVPNKGSKTTLFTYNWCDKTTWFKQATYKQGITASTGDNQTYTLADQFLIDTYHGKITQEDFLVPESGSNTYRVKVRVNGEEKTEQDPHYGGNHGDYVINYASGTIQFHSALSGSDEVVADYYAASGSCWVLKPDHGKVLEIVSVEVQFSQDVDLQDSIHFQAYGMVNHFAPQLMEPPPTGSSLPSGTLIPLGEPDIYKTMFDYYNDANGAYPVIPAIGGSSWRGAKKDVYSFPWKYQTVSRILSSKGMEVRINLEHDTPFGGDSATATFYCLVTDE